MVIQRVVHGSGIRWAGSVRSVSIRPQVPQRPLSGPVALLRGFLLRRSGVASLEEPGGDTQEGGYVSGEQ